MPKVKVTCEACGKAVFRYPSQVSKHPFCSRVCARRFNGERMRLYNQTENPMNTANGWTQEKKDAVRLGSCWAAAHFKEVPETFTRSGGNLRWCCQVASPLFPK